MNLIVLAAGQGTRLRPFTNNFPKCLTRIAGESILDRVLSISSNFKFEKIVVVGGYKASELANDSRYQLVVNHNYIHTNMVESLFCARDFFGDGFIVCYGDIFFSNNVMARVYDGAEEIGVVVDDDWRQYWEKRFVEPLSDAETLKVLHGRIVEIGGKPSCLDEIESQYIGLLAFRQNGVQALVESYETFRRELDEHYPISSNLDGAKRMYFTDLLQNMVDTGQTLSPIRIAGGWAEIDTLADIAVAEQLELQGRFK